MEACNPQLTPEIRQALAAHPDEPLYISDEETKKVYVLVEKGKFPQLEEDYIREGLDMARAQIANGETSTASIQAIISEAQRRQAKRN